MPMVVDWFGCSDWLWVRPRVRWEIGATEFSGRFCEVWNVRCAVVGDDHACVYLEKTRVFGCTYSSTSLLLFQYNNSLFLFMVLKSCSVWLQAYFALIPI
jgi:hypothetical protein